MLLNQSPGTANAAPDVKGSAENFIRVDGAMLRVSLRA
jgi:hypothetical protein